METACQMRQWELQPVFNRFQLCLNNYCQKNMETIQQINFRAQEALLKEDSDEVYFVGEVHSSIV